MKGEKRNVGIVVILVLIILVLLGFIIFSFAIKPAVNGYIINKQVEAKDVVLGTLLMQIQQQGYTQISDRQGNSIILVPLQQGGQPQQVQQGQVG